MLTTAPDHPAVGVSDAAQGRGEWLASGLCLTFGVAGDDVVAELAGEDEVAGVVLVVLGELLCAKWRAGEGTAGQSTAR